GVGARRELLNGLAQRTGVDLEGQRKDPAGREHLRLADVEHLARGVGEAFGGDRRQDADRADASIGDDLFAVQTGGVHLKIGGALVPGPSDPNTPTPTTPPPPPLTIPPA